MISRKFLRGGNPLALAAGGRDASAWGGRLAPVEEIKPTIRVTLNQSVLYKGPAPFTQKSWSFMTLALDWEQLREKDNRLTIENISPREKWSKPLTYYLNYAIVRPKNEEEAEGNGLLPNGLLD